MIITAISTIQPFALILIYHWIECFDVIFIFNKTYIYFIDDIKLAKDVRQTDVKPIDPPKPPPCPPPPPMNIPIPPPLKSQTTIPAPPIPGLMPAPDGAMTIKRKHVTKYKLPTLNWMPLKPNQVCKRSTDENTYIFN